jgi:hypothetical protein
MVSSDASQPARAASVLGCALRVCPHEHFNVRTYCPKLSDSLRMVRGGRGGIMVCTYIQPCFTSTNTVTPASVRCALEICCAQFPLRASCWRRAGSRCCLHITERRLRNGFKCCAFACPALGPGLEDAKGFPAERYGVDRRAGGEVRPSADLPVHADEKD